MTLLSLVRELLLPIEDDGNSSLGLFMLRTSFASDLLESLLHNLLQRLVSENLEGLTSEEAWVSHLEYLRRRIWPGTDSRVEVAKKEMSIENVPFKTVLGEIPCLSTKERKFEM